MHIHGVDVYEFIIGNAEYIVSQNMFVSWSGQQLSPMFQSYNLKYSSIRICIKYAFGILKEV